MARIRSIKPGFFKNEDLAELSFAHRLCFQGLWCHADREGRLEDRPRRLKAEIFPFDEVDMNALLNGLVEKGFIQRYTADGAAYIAVTTFRKHQRPKHDEPVSTIPAPLLGNPRLFGDCSDAVKQEDRGQRTEDSETGRGSADAAPADGAELSRAPDLAEAWNRLTEPPIPRCRELSSERKRKCRIRLTERPLTEWEQVFGRIQASRFCRGENDRGWMATFDWVIGSPDVAVKVLEGKYDDRKAQARPGPVIVADWGDECRELHRGVCRNRHEHLQWLKHGPLPVQQREFDAKASA